MMMLNQKGMKSQDLPARSSMPLYSQSGHKKAEYAWIDILIVRKVMTDTDKLAMTKECVCVCVLGEPPHRNM